jgi:transcriptional regulator with AAA-type ATPase domain
MVSHFPTNEDSVRGPRLPTLPEPGLVVLLAAGRPATAVIAVDGRGVVVGRASPPDLFTADDRLSRSHVRVTRVDGGWQIDDLGSRNGTFVEGRALDARASLLLPSPVVLRIGRSVLWGVDDTRPFVGGAPGDVDGEGPIAGGLLRKAYGEIALASRSGDTVCVHGESGSGKELAARVFHEACNPASAAPFVAVNCASIPESLAERLLFGARKGAFSGASDAEGYVQAAHGGTLFLDEIAELGAAVQAKLLRVVETREVLPLGALRPAKVTFSLCVASHKSLRDEVRSGRFREDLYFRIGRPEVHLPALRDRLDEVPVFAARELRKVNPSLAVTASLVEACCLRPWPGNVRELLRELRRAAHRALQEGLQVVEGHHLSSDAGVALSQAAPVQPRLDSVPVAAREQAKSTAPPPTDDAIRRALADHGGNVRGTARALGLHRNQLRRWLAKHPEVTADGGAGDPADDESEPPPRPED